MLCPRCRHRNPDDAHFCSNCGTPLQQDTTVTLSPIEVEEEAVEEAAPPLADLEPGQGLLVVQRGPVAGSKFLIDKDVTTAGRHPESDIFLDDVTVSRKHVRFRREGGKFFVHDEGSLNGTYVNRQRVEDTELATGDELQIGKFKLLFYMGE
jgi:pSer/pThr/pTyr-binding forkhead associated (FHA) protein